MPEAIGKVLTYYADQRADGEPFKDFVERVGAGEFESLLAEFKQMPELNRETIGYYMDWDKTVKYVLERGEGECAV